MTTASDSTAPPVQSQTSEAFRPKLDPKEQARMDAMMANMNKQTSQFICDESDVKTTLESMGVVTDLKSIPTLYFKNCRGCEYTIEHRTVKVLIENCHDSKFHFKQPILTATLEAWKCKSVHISSPHSIKTFQLDLSHGMELELDHIDKFGTVVWNSVEDLNIRFKNSPAHNHTTGFKRMLTEHPDSNEVIDQFIIRSMNAAIKEERCIRLKNGFLSTEREAAEWERKNELFKERYIAKFLKESGITINKKAEKTIPPNSACPCGSKAKYKKCCFNKKVLTGTEQEIKTDVYTAPQARK